MEPRDVERLSGILNKTIEVCYRKLAKLKAECTHVGAVLYCPDPSGNNDSDYYCTACNASWKRLPEGVSIERE